MQKIKSIVLFFLCITLIFLPKYSVAQSFSFQNYSVEDGLPFVNVSTIYQDSKGNLWSGGYGGLSKFDGISFTNYTPKNGLLNHSVTCITEDNAKNLWIGTISGLNKFDGANFVGYTTKNGLISNVITSVLKDKKGNLWFGTQEGLSKFSNEKFTNYSKKDGLVDDEINTLFEDSEENIWIGTKKGLSKFDGKKFTNYTTHQKLPSNTINAIVQDSSKILWIATNKGLCYLNTKNESHFETVLKQNIKTILIDFKNVFWIGTESGLVKWKNKKFVNYPIRIDQNSNLINYLYQDYEHNLWIGTYAGLFKYRGTPFISYGLNEGLFSNFIFGITRDSKKNLWIGSQNGLFLNSKKTNSFFIKLSDFDSTSVNAILEHSSNSLWIATNKGLKIIENNALKIIKDTSSVFKNNINCFYTDSKNNIWIGGNKEIYKYDGKKFTQYVPSTIKKEYQVWTFVEDQQGVIWIGTYLGGLIKYENQKFTDCLKQADFISDSYLASLKDTAGNLFFATLDGVLMFNPQSKNSQKIYFTEANGMSSDLVYSLTFGKMQNEIWAGTNQGLNKINIDEFKKLGKKTVIPFGKQEGFSGVECNSNGTWVDKDGTIWFGTVNGLIKYNPNEYIENVAESKINITGFSLFYNDTVLQNKIHLPYNQNNITFKYTGICLTNSAKVKYSHILDGFEKKWSPASSERLTNYSNLPSGTYTFKVISSNNEGVWNKTPATFTFTINRPFWKTIWFYVLLFGIIVLIIIVSVRLKIHQIKVREQNKTQLNKKIANIESQALRAQMNPHFIFNTLSSIQHYISNNDTDAALKYLSKFAKLMRKIMDNSKQQMISVSEEIDALKLYLELEVMRFDKKFDYTISIDKEIDPHYDRVPSMLIQPYVENAIIHGLLPMQGAGKIAITLQKQNDTILCIIEDNGIGRTKSKEYNAAKVMQHKSMGMSITQERLNLLNSSLNSNISCEIIDLYEKGESSGTRVKLIIPIETNE